MVRRGFASAAALAVVLGGISTSSAGAVEWGPRASVYPAVGGDPLANARLPQGPGKLIGVNDDFDDDLTAHEAQIGKADRAGVNIVRRTLSWTTHEWHRNFEDFFQWRETRTFYATALAHGLTPMFVLTGSPAWATTLVPRCGSPNILLGHGQYVPPCDRPPDDSAEMNGEWVEFVTKVAREFPRAVFEIWNEPNIDAFWNTPAGPDPERWAKLTVLARNAIKAVNESIPVLGCSCAGLTPGTFPDGSPDPVGGDHVHNKNIATDDFLRRAYAAPNSISGMLDGLSLHFFPQGFQPFAPFDFGAGSHFAELVSRLRSVAADNGEADKPIWIDEVGYWTRDIIGQEQFVVTEEQKAGAFAELTRLASTTPDLRSVIFHRAIDGKGGNVDQGSVRQASFGILYRGDRAGQPLLGAKPAFCRLEAMTGVLDSADPACPTLAAPDTVITSPAPGALVPEDVSVAFGAAGGGTALFECSLDGASMSRCSSPVGYAGLEPGPHTFRTRAYRLDGAQDLTPAERMFTVEDAGQTTTSASTSTTASTSTSTETSSSTETSTETTTETSTETTTVPTSSSTSMSTAASTTSTEETSTETSASTETSTSSSTADTTSTETEPTTTITAPLSTSTSSSTGVSITTPTSTTQTTTITVPTSTSGTTSNSTTTTPAPPVSKCDVTGTPGDDVLYGTWFDDRICGLGGNDTIFALGDSDEVIGGPGHDIVMGGNGTDVVHGQGGRDRLMGGPGDDELRGGAGDDRLNGGAGRDRLMGGAGTNRKQP